MLKSTSLLQIKQGKEKKKEKKYKTLPKSDRQTKQEIKSHYATKHDHVKDHTLLV